MVESYRIMLEADTGGMGGVGGGGGGSSGDAASQLGQLMLMSILSECADRTTSGNGIGGHRHNRRASGTHVSLDETTDDDEDDEDDESEDSDYVPPPSSESEECAAASSSSSSASDDGVEQEGRKTTTKKNPKTKKRGKRRKKKKEKKNARRGRKPKTRPSNSNRRKRRERSSRNAAFRALARIRGGVLDDDETRYLRRLPRDECRRYEGLARAVARKVARATPLLYRVLDWPVDAATKSLVCGRVARLGGMSPGEGEHAKLSSWVAGVEALPIGRHCKLPVNIATDPPADVERFLREARTRLDAAVYGHAPAKDEIVRLCAQWIRNPDAPTQALAIQGPMGNGKTTLVKNGIAKVLHRPFAFIALGGAQDSSFLQGFEYTYEGARCGRIADAVSTAGVMNPVIFLDELDKLSDTPRGREIQQTLVHLLDRSQNSHFRDRYFAGIDLDLSRAVFVLSYNDPEKIDPILLDRMRIVVTKGFSVDDKVKIAREFILPEVLTDIGLTADDVHVSDGAVRRLITCHTKEKGVRCLRRAVHQICGEVNLRRLLGTADASKPSEITEDNVGGFVGSLKRPGHEGPTGMYM